MIKQSAHPFVPQEDTSAILGLQTEAKLHYSELRYRRLFETAQDGILILDASSGNIVDANPFLEKLLGYSNKELLGKKLWQIGVFKDIVDSKSAFEELQTKGYIRYKDLPLETKGGKSIDVEFVSNVYMVDKEKVIQCNIRDITNRKKAELAVKARTLELEQLTQKQEETKRAMLNIMEDLSAAKMLIETEKVKDEAMLASIGEGLIAVDTDRKITIVNKAAETMLGWKIEELIGKMITCLSLEDEDGKTIPPGKQPTYLALSTGRPVNMTYFSLRKDKTRFPIAINVTPVKLGGKVIGAIDIFRDITQEKEIDQAKSEFVSLASHQLRTPLGISKWYIEALRSGKYLNDAPNTAKKYVDVIYKNNERLLVLVRDLLSISRIDQGKIRNTPKLVNIIEIIKSVIKEMNILALKTGVNIQLIKKKTEIPKFLIDPLRVQEVIENLVANAITYSHPSGVVEITVDQKDDRVIITVKDNGVGISSEDQKKLFTKFFRSEQAIAKNTEGSGLGLYVVKSYVDGWGGNISVHSSLGKGSTFSITLPIDMKKKKEGEI